MAFTRSLELESATAQAVADAPKSQISGEPGLAGDPFDSVLTVVPLIEKRPKGPLRSIRATAALNNHLHSALRE
jgi:hypothetical protein